MREKARILHYLNARAIRAAVFSALCRFPPVRKYFNYYQRAECFENAALPGSVQTATLYPVRDDGMVFSEKERQKLPQTERDNLDNLKLTYKMARTNDVTVLGSSGVTIRNDTGLALYLDGTRKKMHPNWVVARPLKRVQGDERVTYINLLGVRKGHRHFAHFFWDTLVPTMVYLKNWHDTKEPVTFLVREDQSVIQKDAFRFLAEDYGVTFQVLPANEKIHCARSIYLAYQNPNHGVDNVLAREYMIAVRDLFLDHYGVKLPAAGGGKKLYISRGDATLRRVKNEKEVLALLEPLGFEGQMISHLPFPEQAALFASADVIVAPHGAALANLMFCRPGTQVLEVFPENYFNDCFIRLSKSMELKNRFLIGGPGDRVKLGYDFDLDELAREVNDMLHTVPAVAEAAAS